MNSNPTHPGAPVRIWTGTLAFLLPCLSLVTQFGVGLVSVLFLVSSLILFKPSRNALQRHWPEVRGVVLAFLLYFLFMLGCALLRGVSMSLVDKPFRMLLAASAMVVVVAARAPRPVMWWGASVGALLALPLVAWQRIVLGIDRPGGLINPITFGDLALVLALVALAGAIDLRRHRGQALLCGAGVLAGLGASLLTGTRGGWIALALAAVVLLRHLRMLDSRPVRMLLAAGAALLASAWLVPAFGVQARFAQGVADAHLWYEGGSVWTNVGTRLELWKGALLLIREHPLFGLDFGACRARLAEFAQHGQLDPLVLPLPHLQNDALQAWATGGVVGFLAWAGLMAAPLLFFSRQLGAGVRAPQFAAALAGMLVVLGYLGFGLTEVIFWSMKGSLFYALMVFLLMGFCLNAKEKIG